MRIISSSLALVLFAAIASPSFAATTADDATKLQKSLQIYFGKGADAVKITPDGDGFKATLDFSAMLKNKPAGAELTISPIEFSLTPEGNGKWKVKHDGPLKLSSKVKDTLDISESFENYIIDGEFDEALGAFSTISATCRNIAVAENMKDPKGTQIKVDAKIDSLEVKGTSVANPAGGIDFKFNEIIGPLAMTETVGGVAEAPLNIQFKIATGTFDGGISGLKSLAVLDLMKFLVAHADQSALVKDQAAFKTLLTNFMPIFTNANGQGTLNKLEAQTPMGPATVEKINFGIDLNGAVKDGKLSETLGFEGIVFPKGLADMGTEGLLPKNASVGFTVSGYDLDALAMTDIMALDLSKNPPLPKQPPDEITQIIMSKGTVDIAINKTSVSNDTYNLTAEGSFAAGPKAQPTGKALVTAKGLDEVMKLMGSAPPEAGLQAGIPAIIAAKGMGKASADGAVTWDIQATPDGKITVNGVDVSKLAK